MSEARRRNPMPAAGLPDKARSVNREAGVAIAHEAAAVDIKCFSMDVTWRDRVATGNESHR